LINKGINKTLKSRPILNKKIIVINLILSDFIIINIALSCDIIIIIIIIIFIYLA